MTIVNTINPARSLMTARSPKPATRLRFRFSMQSVASWLMMLVLVWNTAMSPWGYGATSEPSSVKPSSRHPLPQPPPPPTVDVPVRHAPMLNGGRIEGSVRQLTGESVTFNGNQTVTGWLIVPGTPQLQINGTVTFGGTVTGTGNPQPTNYTVTLNSGTTLGQLVNRTDPISLPTVPAPPAPTGTRSVTLDAPGQSPGDFSTLRNLTLEGNAGLIDVPPGTYGNFTANNTNGFTFGVAGATQASVYNLQQLTLNPGTQLNVVGPVVINLATGISLS